VITTAATDKVSVLPPQLEATAPVCPDLEGVTVLKNLIQSAQLLSLKSILFLEISKHQPQSTTLTLTCWSLWMPILKSLFLEATALFQTTPHHTVLTPEFSSELPLNLSLNVPTLMEAKPGPTMLLFMEDALMSTSQT